MGCDIHSAVEVRDSDGKWRWDDRAVFPDDLRDGQFTNAPFDWRSYGMFGFLANVRNYSRVPPLADARGLPDDLSPALADEESEPWLGDHSHSWLGLNELLAFDYDQTFEDRRTTKQTGPNSWDGAALADKGEGRITTFREFLGSGFFAELERLKTFGDPENVRIVFGFDS